MVSNAPKPKAVDEAKARLRAVTTQSPDYIQFIRQHPVGSAGVAFAAGILLRKLGKLGIPPSLFSLGLQLLKKL